MRVLALESSTKLGGVALFEDGHCLTTRESLEQKSHSEVLHVYTEEILKLHNLKLSDLDLFACGIGPGSFTGIRVGLNIAKAFGYSFNRPVVGIDSLTNLAFLNRSDESPVLCLINAYKNMSYFAEFHFENGWPKVVRGPSVIPMKDLRSLLKSKIRVVGDGYLAYEKFLPESLKSLMILKEKSFHFPTASGTGSLAFWQKDQGPTLDWKSIKPLYIRSSEAEETKRGIVWSPLDFKE